MSKASQKAIDIVEANGGEISTSYYNKVGLRAHLKPEKYDDCVGLPHRALPKKKLMAYYLNPENRGYLLKEKGKERLKVCMTMKV